MGMLLVEQFNSKSMTTIVSSFQKNWGSHIRDLIVGVVVAWMAFNWATKSNEKAELVKKVDEKLNIVEFQSHEKENDRDFRSLSRSASETATETNQLLRQILEQQAKTSTDIEWIKRKVK